MSQFLAVVVLVGFTVGCALLWEEFHHDSLAPEVDNYEMGSWERRGADFDGDDGDREGGTAAVRDDEIATVGRADEASEEEDSGDIGLARTLPLEG